MAKLTAAQTAIEEVVKKHPEWPALTLAKMAYRVYPELWTNLEACRTAVRKRLGVCGKSSRREDGRKPRQPGDEWRSFLPPGRTYFKDKTPFVIEGASRTLILSDVHVPYHDLQALDTAIEFGIKQNADLVLLNGDFTDWYKLSDWGFDPRGPGPAEEVDIGSSILGGLRSAFPSARIVWKEGNHEERFYRYMCRKAPELLGLKSFTWAEAFDLNEYGVETVAECRDIYLGKLTVIHGHEYKFNISNPVGPARGLFLQGVAHALCGHFHQVSQYTHPSIRGRPVSCWSTGCLCDLKPGYSPKNKWAHGFAFVEIEDDNGTFRVENKRIVDGKAY